MAGLDPLLALLSFGQPDEPTEGVPVREWTIPGGDAGARATVKAMAQAARQALREPLTLRAAARIMPASLPPADRAFFLREFLATHWVFHPDPIGVELLRTPNFLLNEIGVDGYATGDCDDLATLAAALGMAGGLRARFVLVSFGRTLPFTHVFCELLTDCQGWVEMDVTRPDQVPEGLTIQRAETHEV